MSEKRGSPVAYRRSHPMLALIPIAALAFLVPLLLTAALITEKPTS